MNGSLSGKIVVDSSVAIKRFVLEDHSAQATDLLTGFRSGQHRLLAPDFINIEFSNIVWKKQVRQGLSAEDAEIILNDFPLIGLALTSSGDLLRDAYNLAVTYDRTIYDSLYLALSIREQCQMVTAEERLFNSIGTALPNVVLLANWS